MGWEERKGRRRVLVSVFENDVLAGIVMLLVGMGYGRYRTRGFTGHTRRVGKIGCFDIIT